MVDCSMILLRRFCSLEAMCEAGRACVGAAAAAGAVEVAGRVRRREEKKLEAGWRGIRCVGGGRCEAAWGVVSWDVCGVAGLC